MGLINNHIYRFINVNFPTQALNVYGASAAASTGRNVCLYSATADPDDPMQKWKYQEETVGKRLHSYVNNGYVLDRSSGITNSAANNAHLCATDSTNGADSALYFVPVSGEENVYRIRLNSRVDGVWRFLTAANNNGTTPASSITTVSQLSSANKNVYWAEEATTVGSTAFKKQCWTVVDLDASSGGNDSGDTGDDDGDDTISNQTLCMPVNNMRINVGYKAPRYDIDPETARFAPHYGADYADNNLPGDGTTVPDNIIASGEGWLYCSGPSTVLGNTACIVYPNARVRNAAGTYTYRDIAVRYWHMENLAVPKLPVGSEPIRIHKNDIIGTMGNEGTATTGIHLHVECDTDANYPNYSPSITGTAGVIVGGTDTTINPGFVFNIGANQYVSVKETKIDQEWVCNDDYEYIGDYDII